jgi:hypothetical protein
MAITIGIGTLLEQLSDLGAAEQTALSSTLLVALPFHSASGGKAMVTNTVALTLAA